MTEVHKNKGIGAWQRGEGGSKITQICVTSFMKGPLSQKLVLNFFSHIHSEEKYLTFGIDSNHRYLIEVDTALDICDSNVFYSKFVTF